jgi:hypothetical protein
VSDDTVQNESRKLRGGEILYLVKDPGAKWRISSYECPQGVEIEGVLFQWLQCLPEDWKDREFENTDQAVEFVQQQVQSGWVPTNRQSDLQRSAV